MRMVDVLEGEEIARMLEANWSEGRTYKSQPTRMNGMSQSINVRYCPLGWVFKTMLPAWANVPHASMMRDLLSYRVSKDQREDLYFTIDYFMSLVDRNHDITTALYTNTDNGCDCIDCEYCQDHD